MDYVLKGMWSITIGEKLQNIAEIKNLDELIKNVGTTTTNNLLIEYILLLRGKSDVLDKIEDALENEFTTIEDIRAIIDNTGNDGLDFME